MANENVIELMKSFDDILSVEVVNAPFEVLLRQRRYLRSEKQQELLLLCEHTLKNEALVKILKVRIAVVKILVLLLPMSKNVIEAWLRENSSEYHYEIHYTLFCYLDWSLELPEANVVAPQVLAMTKSYLQNVSQEIARAALMAGDMLGDHWEAFAALSTLCELAITAKYVAGRVSALYGLNTLLSRQDVTQPLRERIVVVVLDVKNNDRSEEIRAVASDILNLSNAAAK